MLLSTLYTALLYAATSYAAHLSITLQPSQHLANPSTLPPTTHAVLLGPPGTRYDVPLRRDNTFHFPDLTEATYLLTIHSRDHFFPPIRLDVTKSDSRPSAQTISAWQTFRGNEWTNKGFHYGTSQEGDLSIGVTPNGVKSFYQERNGFSLLSFVKSPMILMALVSVGMIFGLPYLQANMDPEMQKEFDEMSKKSPLSGSDGAANQIQNFDLAGWMAGKSSGASTPSGGGGNKRK